MGVSRLMPTERSACSNEHPIVMLASETQSHLPALYICFICGYVGAEQRRYFIVTDFWDKPLFWAVRPVQNGEAEYPTGSEQCKSICKAKAIDLTRERYAVIRQELQFRRLESICRQLRSVC
jgi:hypothetical protein